MAIATGTTDCHRWRSSGVLDSCFYGRTKLGEPSVSGIGRPSRWLEAYLDLVAGRLAFQNILILGSEDPHVPKQCQLDYPRAQAKLYQEATGSKLLTEGRRGASSLAALHVLGCGSRAASGGGLTDAGCTDCRIFLRCTGAVFDGVMYRLSITDGARLCDI